MPQLTTAHKDKLMADLRVMIADAEELLRVTADQASGNAAEVRGRIQGRLQQARAELAQLQGAAVAQVKAAGHAADEFVHENPWKSVGVAAGIGLVIGLLIGRR
ncbi:MAG: DUF883 family protein [Pseudomonadota bacterium]|uniref:DUF883 family protein n=1 Tax=Curvibacter delicatus TaxID=80879 RepID=UPI000AECD0C3|nr:DUF883 family protein [Curvibacter delicatus]MEA3395718.1 DUF883 family protein [Pseudomonadota bacterium]